MDIESHRIRHENQASGKTPSTVHGASDNVPNGYVRRPWSTRPRPGYRRRHRHTWMCWGGRWNSGSSDNDTKRRLRSRIWADLPPKGTTLGEHNCWRRGPPYPRMTLCTGHRVAEAEAPERLTTVTGWRRVGREVWEAAGVFRPIEQIPLRRTLGERPGRHLKPGRRPASVRHVCRATEASNRPCTWAASHSAPHPTDRRTERCSTEEVSQSRTRTESATS